jgi:hypothetical protein
MWSPSGYGAVGAWKSTDGGQTWVRSAGADAAFGDYNPFGQTLTDLYHIEILPDDPPNHVLATYHYGFKNASDGGFGETWDGGATWVIHPPPAGIGTSHYVIPISATTWAVISQDNNGQNGISSSKGKVVPNLMPKALWWFRWGAVYTFLFGFLYYMILLGTEKISVKIVGFLVAWTVAWLIVAALLRMSVAGGPLKDGRVLAVVIAVLVLIVAWGAVVYMRQGGSNRTIAIAIGGGMGYVMFMNVWMIIWPLSRRSLPPRRPRRRRAPRRRPTCRSGPGAPSSPRARTPGSRSRCSSSWEPPATSRFSGRCRSSDELSAISCQLSAMELTEPPGERLYQFRYSQWHPHGRNGTSEADSRELKADSYFSAR